MQEYKNAIKLIMGWTVVNDNTMNSGGSGSSGGIQSSPRNLCGICNKKLPLSAFPCRCKKSFCVAHRGDSDHSCPYDYKKEGLESLSTMLVKVQAEKVSFI